MKWALLFCVWALSVSQASALREDELDHCSKDEDCVVVPYRHCCGLRKRAINKKHKIAYEAHPEWQKFDTPSACATMGACLSDEHVTAARCTGTPILRCQLRRD